MRKVATRKHGADDALNDDLRFYIGILRRRFLPFLLVTLLVGALATVIVVLLPPMYRSEATILVEAQQIPEDLVRSTVTSLADERIQVTRQRITAREELLTIADKYSLFPTQRKDMSTTALVTLLRERIIIQPFDLKLKTARSQAALTIAFTVGFDYERADTAAKVANELVTLILDADIRNRINKASETTQFLSRESTRLSTELTKVDQQLTKFKLENREGLPERVAFQMQALERAESNRKEIEREIGNLQESKRLVELELAVRATSNSGADGGASPNVLQQQLDVLKAELAGKSVIYAPTHPEIKQLRSQVRIFEEQLAAAGAAIVDSKELTELEKQKLDMNTRIATEKKDAIERQIKLYTSQKASVENSIREITRILSNSPEVQNRLGLLERQRAGLQKTMDDVAEKLSAAKLGEQLEKDQQAERFEVIEQPIVPQEPIWPKIPRLLAIGYGVAAMSGAAVVGLLELLNRSVRSSADIVKAINRHPIVVIPYIVTKEEGRRRLRKLLLIVASVAAAALFVTLAMNFFYMPLDELYYKVLDRLNN